MVKYSVDNIFASLSDPMRREILLKVQNQDLDLSDFAKAHKVSLPAISKHLKKLEEANLLHREKQGRTYNFTLTEMAKYWLKQFDGLEKFLKKG